MSRRSGRSGTNTWPSATAAPTRPLVCRTCCLRDVADSAATESIQSIHEIPEIPIKVHNPFAECSICLAYRNRHQASRPASRAIRDRLRAQEAGHQPPRPPQCHFCRARDQPKWIYVRRNQTDMRLCEPCGQKLAAVGRCSECKAKLVVDNNNTRSNNNTSSNTSNNKNVCATCTRYFEKHGQRRSEALRVQRWLQRTGREANPDLYARCQKCASIKTRTWHFVPDDQRGDGVVVNGIRVCDDCIGRHALRTTDLLYLLSCTRCAVIFAANTEDKRECRTCAGYRARTGKARPSKLIVQAQARKISAVKSRDRTKK